ncbi:MAG: MFS transporter [Hydrogenophilaceae bacterium]|jgi:MFS family permease|nr:MFS transporter [Hydrogenophilaceae bacterium]
MTSLRNVAALIAAVTILQAGQGLLGFLLPLAFALDQHTPAELGLVAAAYSAGFMIGAMGATAMLARVGHIRVFAACAAILSVSTLALHGAGEPWSWALARALAGVAVALMFAAVESWMSASVGRTERGSIMGVYLVATRAALALGPFLLFGLPIGAAEPWMIAAGLATLAIAPVCFTSAAQPPAPKAQPLALRAQFNTAPAAVIAAFGAGFINSGMLTLAPLYAAERFGQAAAATFYSAAWIGSLALQWPAGRLSDSLDRRVVIAMLTGLAALAALTLAIFRDATPLWLAALLYAAWGAGSLCFYGIAVAHMADRAEPGRLAQAASGVLFVWAAGSVIGPVVLGAAVDLLGGRGVFWFGAVSAAALTAAMFWRGAARAETPPAEKEAYAAKPETSVAAAEIAYGEERD